MGYSTMLYAVDVGELKSAVGSGDAALLERVRTVVQQRQGGGRRVDPRKGPRVRVTWNSEIYLNGKRVTADELKHALLNPEWAGTNLYIYSEINPPPGQKREGEYKELGSFSSKVFMPLLQFFAERGIVFKEHYVGIENVFSAELFAKLGISDDELSGDQALEELIAGKFTRQTNTHVYGYALEHLCATIGTVLDSVGTDRLRSLKLKTPLSKTRPPVKLPKNSDFPYISYLDAEELRAEVARLKATDLASPKQPELEEEREVLLCSFWSRRPSRTAASSAFTIELW